MHEALSAELDENTRTWKYGCICGFFAQGSDRIARKALLDHMIETDVEEMTTRTWHRLTDHTAAVDGLLDNVEQDLERIRRAVDTEAASIPPGTEKLVAISHHDWVRLLQALQPHPAALLDVAALGIMAEEITREIK